jgi:hypothetical protein
VAGEPGRLFLGAATSSRVLDKVFESFVDAELDALMRVSSSGASPRRPLGFAFVWYDVDGIAQARPYEAP